MKKLIFLLLAPLAALGMGLLLPGFLSAQNIYVGCGLNQSLAGFSNLNYVISRYNETRTWLDNQMEPMHTPGDICVTMGYAGAHTMVGFSFVGRSSRSRAWGDNGASIVERDLRMRMNQASFELGFGNAPLFAGLSLDVGAFGVATRVDEKDVIREADFESIYTQFGAGTTLFAQLFLPGGEEGGVGLILRPYVQFPFYKTDMTDVSMAINPYTWAADDETRLISRPVNFGVMLALALRSKPLL